MYFSVALAKGFNKYLCATLKTLEVGDAVEQKLKTYILTPHITHEGHNYSPTISSITVGCLDLT